MNHTNASILNNYLASAVSFTYMDAIEKHAFMCDLISIIRAERYLLSYMEFHSNITITADFAKAILIWNSRFHSIMAFFDNIFKNIQIAIPKMNSYEIELYEELLSNWSVFFQQGFDLVDFISI